MKTINKILMAVLVAAFMCAVAKPAAALQRVEDDNFSVTSMLPTQYVLYTLTGSTGATSVYYKVTAVVGGGVGEIKPASLTVADANAVRSSTNTLLIRWAPVIGASSYNVYRSTVSSSTYFYLLGNVARGTHSLLDYGQDPSSAYSAPDPRGGNIEAENDMTVGDDLSVADDAAITGDLTVTGAFSGKLETFTLAQMNADAPAAAGIPVYITNGVQERMCISTGTAAGAYMGVSSSTVHCQ